MKIQKNDFIEVEYTAILKEDNSLIFTTNEEIAKRNNIYDDGIKYKPVIFCVGQHQILKAVDDSFIDKEIGESYRLELKSDLAFGKKDIDLIEFVPTTEFSERGITPLPGLQVNIDGEIGIVKTVSGGRTLVDFNHPLAGKDIIYDITIKRHVTDTKERLASLFEHILGEELKIEINDNEFVVFLPKGIEIKDEMKDKIKELIPDIKMIRFVSS